MRTSQLLDLANRTGGANNAPRFSLKRLVDYDPLNRISTHFEYDELTDTTTLTRSQDSSPILEWNKALQNNEDYSKQGIKDSMWHYAQIPTMLIEKWLLEEGLDVFNKNHAQRLFRKLNDPEFRHLKTTTKTHMVRDR